MVAGRTRPRWRLCAAHLRTWFAFLTHFRTYTACRHTVHGGAHARDQALEAADRSSHVRPTLSAELRTAPRTLTGNPGPRRVFVRLFYKFSPVGTSHKQQPYNPQDYEKYGLTDRQRAILAPPQAPNPEAAARL